MDYAGDPLAQQAWDSVADGGAEFSLKDLYSADMAINSEIASGIAEAINDPNTSAEEKQALFNDARLKINLVTEYYGDDGSDYAKEVMQEVGKSAGEWLDAAYENGLDTTTVSDALKVVDDGSLREQISDGEYDKSGLADIQNEIIEKSAKLPGWLEMGAPVADLSGQGDFITYNPPENYTTEAYADSAWDAANKGQLSEWFHDYSGDPLVQDMSKNHSLEMIMDRDKYVNQFIIKEVMIDLKDPNISPEIKSALLGGVTDKLYQNNQIIDAIKDSGMFKANSDPTSLTTQNANRINYDYQSQAWYSDLINRQLFGDRYTEGLFDDGKFYKEVSGLVIMLAMFVALAEASRLIAQSESAFAG